MSKLITTQMKFEEVMIDVKGHFRGQEEPEGHPLLSSAYDKIVQTTAKRCKPLKMMEIGMNAGHSVVAYLHNCPDLVVHAVDICEHPYVKDCAEALEAEYGDRFQFGQCDSQTINKDGLIGYDLVRIDGGHHIANVTSDYDKCKVSGVKYIIFDDLEMVQIRQLVDHIVKSPNHPYKHVGRSTYPNSDGGNSTQIVLERYDDVTV
jgi:hypothetical protein